MKWDVKHDRAKRVIDAFLDNAGDWQEREDLVEGLNKEEKELVDAEIHLMIESIRKRYKLDVKLPQQAVEIQKKDEKVEETAAKDPETKTEPAIETEVEVKPKRTRKASTGEKKTSARKPRAKKKEDEAKENE